MAVIFVDGFDAYNGITSAGGISSVYSYFLTVNNFALTTGRFGGQGVIFYDGAISYALSNTYNEGTVGFALRVDAYPPSSYTSVFSVSPGQFINAPRTYGQFTIQMDAAGTLSAYRSNTLLGTTSASLALNVWNYVEIEFNINDTTGFIKIYFNGNQVLNLTGIDSKNLTAAGFNQFMFGTNTIIYGDFTIDDLYLTDTPTRLGEQRVETLRPSTDTAQKQWTPSTGSDNYATIDETLMSNTDFVSASSAGVYDLYDFSNLSSVANSITAVTVSALSQKTDAAARAIAFPVKSGSVTSDGANNYLSLGYTLNTRLLETDPNTSSAWTSSAVNSIQAGIKVTI